MDAQKAEVADKQATEGAVWRATGFDRTMIDAVPHSSSSSNSSGLSKQETAGSILERFSWVLCIGIAYAVLTPNRCHLPPASSMNHLDTCILIHAYAQVDTH
eukprot:1147859-Pelagomonas_calceolata.AAC.6